MAAKHTAAISETLLLMMGESRHLKKKMTRKSEFLLKISWAYVYFVLCSIHIHQNSVNWGLLEKYHQFIISRPCINPHAVCAACIVVIIISHIDPSLLPRVANNK